MSDLLERIVSDPEIRSGKPVIRGTRITVSDVLEYMAGGMTPDEIVEDFPQLTPEDIRAVLSFAAERCDRSPRNRAVTAYSYDSFRKAAAELHPIYEECLQYWNGSKNEMIPKGLFLQLLIAFRLVYLETESANFIRLLRSMHSNATPAEIESLMAIEEAWNEALETCIGLSVDGRVYGPKNILNVWLNGVVFHQDEAKQEDRERLDRFPDVTRINFRFTVFRLAGCVLALDEFLALRSGEQALRSGNEPKLPYLFRWLRIEDFVTAETS